MDDLWNTSALVFIVEIKPEHCINENLAPLQLLLTYALSPHTLQRYYTALNLHTILLRLMKEQENWLELVSPFCRHMALDQGADFSSEGPDRT